MGTNVARILSSKNSHYRAVGVAGWIKGLLRIPQALGSIPSLHIYSGGHVLS